jgi:hypothetical protein
MVSKELLGPILADDTLTRGLGDAEARVLVEWLVDRIEEKAGHNIRGDVSALCSRARAIARFVHLWCIRADHGAACQLAATERFAWPFPAADADPCDVMLEALAWEQDCGDSTSI